MSDWQQRATVCTCIGQLGEVCRKDVDYFCRFEANDADEVALCDRVGNRVVSGD